MLKVILFPHSHYRIYLDIKDTRSKGKVDQLYEVLSNNLYDFRREIIERVQTVRSHEVEQLQLADLLIGIISYANRNLETSRAKQELVQRMRERSGYKLTSKTLYLENKVNLFLWQADWGNENGK
jgi:predicted RecB family endonuclease